jgi:hypothetical protein
MFVFVLILIITGALGIYLGMALERSRYYTAWDAGEPYTKRGRIFDLFREVYREDRDEND